MRFDFRDVVKMIEEAKPDIKLGLSLEFDCFIETKEPKPLVKVLNYLINFANKYASDTIQVSVNVSMDSIMLNVVSHTNELNKPAISDKVSKVLEDYAGTIQYGFKANEFIMILLTFTKDDIVIR